KSVDAHLAVLAISVRDGQAMIYDVPVPIWKLQHGVAARPENAQRIILLQDGITGRSCKRSYRRRSHCVGHEITGRRSVALRPHKIVNAVSLEADAGLTEARRGDVLRSAFKRNHVAVEFSNAGPSVAEIQIGSPVVIDENVRIDGVRAVLTRRDQRMTQGVVKRTVRRGRRGHANLPVRRKIKIVRTPNVRDPGTPRLGL